MPSVPYRPLKTHAGLPPWSAILNFFLDDLLRILPAPHFKVLIYVWRRIYGKRHASKAFISLAEIGTQTHVSRAIVAESLRWFSNTGLIGRHKRGTMCMNEFTLNFNPDRRRIVSDLVELIKESKRQRKNRGGRYDRQTGRGMPVIPSQYARHTLPKTYKQEQGKDAARAERFSQPAETDADADRAGRKMFMTRLKEVADGKAF